MQRLVSMFLLLSALLVSGCADVAYWQLREFYGLDCRPEALHNGNCVPVKKGASNAQTAHPESRRPPAGRADGAGAACGDRPRKPRAEYGHGHRVGPNYY